MTKLLTPKEVAEMLDVGDNTARELMRSNQIKSVLVCTGKKKYFRATEETLHEFIKRGGIKE